MSVEPGYGGTPLEPDEADALTPRARLVFGDEPKRLELYEAEEAIADEVSVRLLAEVADGVLDLGAVNPHRVPIHLSS